VVLVGFSYLSDLMDKNPKEEEQKYEKHEQKLHNDELAITIDTTNNVETKIDSVEEARAYKRKLGISMTMIFVLLILLIVNQQGFVMFLTAYLTWVKNLGILGNIIFCIMFILISFPFILGGYTPLTLGAGAIYGIVIGTVTVSLGSTLGACLTFWVSRCIARKWVENKVKQSKEFQFFMLLLQGDNQWLVLFLARMAPIPFGLQNCFFALTNISFRNFILSTFIGLLPFQVVWTHLGTTLRHLGKITSGELEMSFWQKLSLFLQLVVVIALIAYFFVLSKKMKQKQSSGQKPWLSVETDTNKETLVVE